MVKIILLLQFL